MAPAAGEPLEGSGLLDPVPSADGVSAEADPQRRIEDGDVGALHVKVKALQVAVDAARRRQTRSDQRIRELEALVVDGEMARDEHVLGLRVRELESEVELHRAARRSTEAVILDLRMLLDRSKTVADDLRSEPAYRLGRLLLESIGGWRTLLSLPFGVLRLVREARQPQGRSAGELFPAEPVAEYQAAVDLAQNKAERLGVDAAEAWAHDQRFPGPILARVLISLGRSMLKADPARAVALARAAVEAHADENLVKALAMTLMDHGSISEADAVLRSAIAAGALLNGTEKRRAAELKALVALGRDGIHLPRSSLRPQPPDTRRVLIYAAQSFPHHWSGTTMRTHGLAQALHAAGLDVDVVTPPGYPPNKIVQTTKAELFDGVRHHRLAAVESAGAVGYEQAKVTGQALARLASAIGATAIVAEAELTMAYPAAVASRLQMMGLVLDCHAVVHAAPEASQTSERTGMLARLEAELANHATQVFARVPCIAAALKARGVDETKILRIPETLPTFATEPSVTDWRNAPALAGRTVIGFVGDPSTDLDLEVLPDLLAILVERGFDVGLAVFGVGTRFQNLRDRAMAAGHGDRVFFGGRPKPGVIANAFASIDIMVVPEIPAPGVARVRYECSAALHHGRRVVTAPTPANAELLGAQGIYVSGSAADYADAIAPWLDPSRKSIVRGDAFPTSVPFDLDALRAAFALREQG